MIRHLLTAWKMFYHLLFLFFKKAFYEVKASGNEVNLAYKKNNL